MRKILATLAAALCGTALAQTNMAALGTAAATNAPTARTQTEINADTAEFDLNTRQAVYRGHVNVEDPQAKMTCGQLTLDLPAAGAHLNRVVAETNVVIDFKDEKGQKYHVTSAKAVYSYKVEGSKTNETVTFTGNPRVETAQSIIESEPMVWDRAKNKFRFFNPRMISTEGINKLTGTNGPALKLF